MKAKALKLARSKDVPVVLPMVKILKSNVALLLTLLLYASTHSQPVNPVQTSKPAPGQTSEAPRKTQTAPEQEVEPGDVIRVKTTLVNSPVLVIGRDGKFVPNLLRENFEIFEDGVKQEIAYFAPVKNPFTVALLIDASRSTAFDLQDIKDAALAFVEKMRPDDRALVVSFAGEIRVLTEPTSDRETLRRAIRNARPGGSTRVYDAVDFVLAKRLDRLAGRTALILFTDGVDNDSQAATFESTLHKAQRTEALIYPVQFSTSDRMKRSAASRISTPLEGTGFSDQDYRRADAYLHQLADTTSTGVYPAFDISDLDRAIASIVDELHNEYSIGYYPRTQGQPGAVRRIEVRVSQSQLVVRARTGYVVDQSGTVVRAPNVEQSTSPAIREMAGSIPLPSSPDPPGPSPEGRWMCKGSNAPSDLAVVKEGYVSHCPKGTRPNDVTNAWFVRRPGRSEILCKGFLSWRGRELAAAPVPAGYVVTGEVASSACSKSNNPGVMANAWDIRLPGPSETVCKGFMIPRGYVVIDERTVVGCPASERRKNAWLIRARL